MPLKQILPTRRKLLFLKKKNVVLGAFALLLLLAGVTALTHLDTSRVSDQNLVSAELGISTASPSGEEGGLVVPASCPSDLHDVPNYGQACGCGTIQCDGTCSNNGPANLGQPCQSAPNACGQTNNGTIQCNGTCSATTPANTACPATCAATHNSCIVGTTGDSARSFKRPSGETATEYYWYCVKEQYNRLDRAWEDLDSRRCSESKVVCVPNTGTSCNSAPNRCGMTNIGTVQCDGSCNAAAPADSACSAFDPVVSIGASPNPVTLGNSITLSWTTTNTASCWASGGWTGWKVNTGGSEAVTPGATTTYTLECWNTFGVSSGQKSITVTVNVPYYLNICGSSCSSGIQYGNGSTISMQDTDPARQLVACYSTSTSCNDPSPSANVTASTTWGESGSNAVDLSGSNPKTMTPRTLAGPGTVTETVTASYSGNNSSFNASVTKFCAPYDCSSDQATVCSGSTYQRPSPTPGCGAVMTTCTGTRLCDYNWKEVAP